MELEITRNTFHGRIQAVVNDDKNHRCLVTVDYNPIDNELVITSKYVSSFEELHQTESHLRLAELMFPGSEPEKVRQFAVKFK